MNLQPMIDVADALKKQAQSGGIAPAKRELCRRMELRVRRRVAPHLPDDPDTLTDEERNEIIGRNLDGFTYPVDCSV